MISHLYGHAADAINMTNEGLHSYFKLASIHNDTSQRLIPAKIFYNGTAPEVKVGKKLVTPPSKDGSMPEMA